MCGIVGYQGTEAAARWLLDGLSRLEYRGYDSAGIGLADESGLTVYKEAGRLAVLTARLGGGEGLAQTVGIGHTRWATHGAPTVQNAHPHLSGNGQYAVVHNGIIENEAALRKELTEGGITLRSETDTELIAQLLEQGDDDDPVSAIRRTVKRLHGSFALGILCAATPQCVYAVRRGSPLLVGVTEHGAMIASDAQALLPFTRRFVSLDEGEIACLHDGTFTLYGEMGETYCKRVMEADQDAVTAERGDYAHFMLKEIEEQPEAFAKTVDALLEEQLPLSEEEARQLRRVLFVGCGSAYHAGLVGVRVFERLVGLPAAAEVASEFRYRQLPPDNETLVIVISQSGETADTLAALRRAKEAGAPTISVVNVAGSSMARESDHTWLTRAGPEVAVATTKGYTTQLGALYVAAIQLASLRKAIDDTEIKRLTTALRRLPSVLNEALSLGGKIHAIAKRYAHVTDAYFIGRGADHAVAWEASLKLKEISYIHSEAYAAGELKHGTISLIEDGTLVVALACETETAMKTMANVQETVARGARVILFTTDETLAAHDVVCIPPCESLFLPSVLAIPLQLFGYYMALERGCDIDRPRNLAKSVTVE